MPNQTIIDIVSNDITAIKALGNIYSSINHPGTKGTAREFIINNLFSKFLKRGFKVGSGHIVDRHGTSSPQMDAIIYNENILPTIFLSGETQLIPIEACQYVFEIKSKITSGEIDSTIDKFLQVMLMETQLNIDSGRNSTSRAIRRGMIAFDTDLTKSREIERNRKIH